MTIVSIIMFVSFLILGICFRRKRGLMLIAGYNTMSAEQRDRIDKDLIARSVGNMMIRLAIYSLALGILALFRVPYTILICFIAIVVDCMVSVIILNKKLDVNPMNSYTIGKKSKGNMLVAVITCVAVIILLFVMVFAGEGDPKVTFAEDKVQITGMYGQSINNEEIVSVTLDDRDVSEITKGAVRTNGYGGIGNSLRGNFSSKDLGKFLLFVNKQSTPTILITTEDKKPIYINMKNSEDTIALYESLKSHIG